MNLLWQDLRFAFRQMRRTPSFFVLAICTLALGIGAATAVFSVLDATFLKPLPYAHQARLVSLQMKSHSGYQQPASYPAYLDMRRDLHSLAALTAVDYTSANLQTATGASPVHVVQGSDDFFEVFGTKPLLGRGYLPGEEQPGRNNVAVLSYGVWQRDFGGRADVIGSPARLNGEAYTVVGVMPRSFRFPMTETTTVYTPLHPEGRMLNARGFHEFALDAVLKPGTTLAQAQADVTREMAALARAYPDSDAGRVVILTPLAEAMNGRVAQPLALMSGAVGALLLIACVNVAGLLFARGVHREHEMALRAAVGASRSRLIRQTITETLTIAVLSALLGAVFAAILLAAMRSFMLTSLTRGADVRVNFPALLAALGLAVLTTLLAGLLPALRLSRVGPNAALRSGTASAGTSRGQQRLRSGFLVTQIALSLVLLSIAALLLQHLRHQMSMDLGYAPDRIMAVRITLGAGDYKTRDPLADFYSPLLERVNHLHGVRGAGLVNLLPIAMYGSNSEIKMVGEPPPPPNEVHLAEYRLVSSGYFEAMGSRQLAGRALSAAIDRPDTANIVVNHAFAREFVAKKPNAVGSQIDDGMPVHPAIVGEYSDMRQAIDQPQLAEMDILIDSEPIKDRRMDLLHLFLVLRTADGTAPMSLVAPVRQIVHALDAGAALDDAMTLRDQLDEALVFQRLINELFTGFAVCAVLLTLVGIYGTVRHEAELRTRDIGVRMALGASRGSIMAAILRRAAVLAMTGLAAGLLLTAGAQRTLATLLELQPEHKGLLLLTTCLGLFVVCELAAFAPARRAAATDPMRALRAE